MQFSKMSILFGLLATSMAAPVARRALTSKTYNEFQVSGGVGGDALAEINAEFPIDVNDLANVSKEDLKIISEAAQVSEQAEVGAGGFNDAIEAVGGKNTPEGAALQVGKIKNKVVKLQTDVLRIKIQTAQGNTASTSTLPQQEKKLATNVALDVANAGKPSTSIDFSG